MTDNNSGGKPQRKSHSVLPGGALVVYDRGPHVTQCTNCVESAVYWTVMGFGWAYLCELCYTQYVAHIREGMIDVPPVKIA